VKEMQDKRLAQLLADRFRVMERLKHRYGVIVVICVFTAALPVVFWALGLTEYRESLQPPLPDRSLFERIALASACTSAAAAFTELAGGLWKQVAVHNYIDSKDGYSIWAKLFAAMGWSGVLFAGYRFFSNPFSAEPIHFSLSLCEYVVGWVLIFWAYIFGH
jgi:hypothetical protein